MGKIGTHIIPKQYLTGFTDKKGKIWTYQKGKPTPFRSNPASTAVINNFYSPKNEKLLNTRVEYPAIEAIKKVKQKKAITPDDRRVLARYCINFLQRVPYSKAQIKSFMPKVAEEVLNEEHVRKTFGFSELSAQQIEIIKKFRHKAETDNQMAEEQWAALLLPDKLPKALPAFEAMTWQFLTFDEEPAFVTSDNPFFYFRNLGIGHQLAEVTFPISQHVALWATWNRNIREGFYPISKEIVAEINQRTVCLSTRDTFFSVETEWIANLVNQETYDLHMIIGVGDLHILWQPDPSR